MIWRRKTKHEFTIPASLDQLAVLGDMLETFLQKAHDMPDAESNRYVIKLAVHELVTNIIRHAYADRDNGTIDFALSLAKGEFRVTMVDSGREFVPQAVAEPDLVNGQEGGYGVFLIERLMDKVTYKRKTNNNEWHLVKQW